MRLDRAIYARGLARSRTHAQELIALGVVTVAGAVVTKPAHVVGDEAIEVRAPHDYVSRGALKLVGALDAFARAGLRVDGRSCLDAGASTGGVTQVLLERGAASVRAVDVGHGQLAAAVAQDQRVDAREGVNVRDYTPETTPEPLVELVTADLSFISLKTVLPALAAWLGPGGDAVLMVKPQFEVGKDMLGAGGVVRSVEDRTLAVVTVADAAIDAGLTVFDVARSPVSGPHGNVEIFVWCGKPWQAEDTQGQRSDGRRALDRGRLESVARRESKGVE